MTQWFNNPMAQSLFYPVTPEFESYAAAREKHPDCFLLTAFCRLPTAFFPLSPVLFPLPPSEARNRRETKRIYGV